METTSENSVPHLRRELGLASATAAIVGEIIAVGIFLTPAGMAKALGSPFWLLVVWLAVGGMTLSGALCYGELAGRFPQAGGAYVFLRESYGPRLSFLYGWMCMLVMDPAISASFAAGIAGYLAYVVHLSALFIKLVAVGAIWALCLLNIISIRGTAWFLRWITWLKLGLLAFLTVWALGFRLGSWSNFKPFVAQHPGSMPLLPALAVGMLGAFFSFGGWWDVSKVAGEIRDPGRTLPRALMFGVIAITLVYIVVSGVFLYLVPVEKVTSDQAFVAQAGEVLFGPTGGIVFSAIVIICLIGSLGAIIMFSPRVYYAMANDGLFFKAIARTHPRFGTPANAILTQGFIASVIVFAGTFEQIISYALFVVILFLGITVAGLFVIRPRQQAGASVMLTPGYPVTPLIFIAMVVLMSFLVAVHSPRSALLGLVVVLAGLPFYEIFRSRMIPIPAESEAG